ncbi:hypothetical protein DFR50_101230 [Roseiarcus fermentans]|uniref:Uncharacterized protein n=1 Tax=Roseiarcus fermentans TaxID=1473586 RepID=A0A366FVW8_9HYPH|nr:hypothetical protein [Roseiarcus fermentans]RBP18286.1 hypothetical protein DFR50_101230 [Roseiarcus fermentans]
MTAPAPPRRFLAPFLGIAFVFAAIGPPVGGATFLPVAALLEAPASSAGGFAFAAVAGMLFGHWILLFPAYVIGLGPAAATGVLYALWDAAAPPRWPRALAAAVIGGLVAYAVALRLAALGTTLDMMFQTDFDAPVLHSISLTEPDRAATASIGTGLVRAFVAAGAVAGLACAMVSSLIGLTMQPTPPPATSGGAVDG